MNSVHARRRTVVGTLISLIGLPSAIAAQVLYGSIVGNVTDETRGAVPGATVTITHNETGVAREAVTDVAGAYHFTAVPSGTYTVTIKVDGFRTFERRDVAVTLNSVTRVDAPLQVGQLTETVTVSAESPILQTERAEVRAELKARELVNLPVSINRNYQYLFRVLPGFTPPAEAHSVPSNPSRALVFNVNGASRSANNIRIDGVSTTNIWLPHVAAYVPALESLETVNVVTSSFDAEQGLAGGSAINVQIRSGTNNLRGSAFEYYTNENLRTRNYFAPAGTPKGDWSYNQYGGTLGGPLSRNKLFFFGSYEGTRDKQSLTRTISVPTEAVRRGDLRASSTPIYDPFTGSPNGSGRIAFPNNMIPAERLDPTAQRLLALMPLPNLTNPDGTIPETNNYFVQAPFVLNRSTLDTKVNWNASDNINVFGRFSVLDFFTENGTNFGRELQGQPLGSSNPGTGEGNTYNVSAGATYTISPTLLLDAHVGFVRMNTGVAQSDIAENKGLDWLGLPGTNGPNAYEGGTPLFDLDTYADIGTTDTFMPYYRSDDQYQTVINVNWMKGRHNIRFGTDIYYQALNHTQPEISGGDSVGARGGFRYQAGPTQILGGPSGNLYNAFASFLLGVPNRIGRLKLVEPYTTRNWQYSLYIRDQWQASSRMTISYGTRWEYFPVPTRAHRGLERYDVDTNLMMIGGVGSVPEDLGVEVSKTMFAPRVGVTFRPTEGMVLRAGFGITNDPYSLARPLRTNHPAVLNLLLNAPNSLAFVSRTSDGIPLIPDPDLGTGLIEVPSPITVFTLDDKFERGYIQSWNVALQKELRWGFVGEAAYIGTRQIDQLGFRELNWSPIGGGQAGRQLNQKFGRTGQTRLIAPIGDSQYDALQSRLDRRFANGFQIAVSYTLSKSTGIAGNANSDGALRINIPEYYDLNESLSDFDRTHNLNISTIVELPFGPGRRWLSDGGVLSHVVGGWQVNSILSFYSGTPFSVTASGTSLNAPENDQRADQVKSEVEILGGIGPTSPYFDPLAFVPVTEARFGTAPFNVLRGPGVKSWDLGIFRQVALAGRMNLQLRVEAFNVTNTPRFSNPGGNVSNLRLNPDGTVNNLNGYAVVTGTQDGSERQVRFGVRLGW
ncbi:MAG TPA: TonB-dependent receptor [Vicinamibacterales bacterium]|nr:TonB-dependent receptor [Vicinamibacterales bacterium]